jgi:hypothetical protein
MLRKLARQLSNAASPDVGAGTGAHGASEGIGSQAEGSGVTASPAVERRKARRCILKG